MLVSVRRPTRRTLPLAAAVAGLALLAAGPADAAPVVVMPAPPSLSTATVHPGDTLTATTRYTNVGTTAGVLVTANQTIRRPGQPHDHPAIWDGDFTNALTRRAIAPGEDVLQTGSLTLSATAPLGQWEVYAAWQDTGGSWHDGPSGTFTVVDPSTPLPPPPAPSPVSPPSDPPSEPTPPTPTPTPAPTPTVGPAAPSEPTLTTQGDAAVVTAPVSSAGRRSFNAADALREARTALRLSFKSAYAARTRFTASCVRNSATKRTCKVSWRVKRYRYSGRVVVELTSTAYTTIVYVKRTRLR